MSSVHDSIGEGGPVRIGDSALRLEDDRLLRGAACFIDDMDRVDGQPVLHACFVRSAYPHARLVGVSTTAAAALPGVVAVLSAQDFADRIKPIYADVEQPGFVRT